MALTSTGYDGSIGEAAWGQTSPYHGAAGPGVNGADDWRVTLAGGDSVAIAPGVGHGWGVTDTLTDPATVTIARPAAGSRHDVIVARRDWATNTTTLAVVQGGTDRVLPPLTVTPGMVAEQALALVHVPAVGNLVIADDLRVTWGVAGVAQSVAGMRGPAGSRFVLAETGRRYMLPRPGAAVPEWEPPAPAPPQVPIIAAGTASVTTNQYGSATITHGLGWAPTSARVQPRLATGSGLVECYVSAGATGLTDRTINVTCKIRTPTGDEPYEGALTYLDWVAVRKGTQAAPIVVVKPDGGTVTTPAPAIPDGDDPADPTETTGPPVTSGGGGDTITRDTDASTAPQIPIPDTPPIYQVSSPTSASVAGILATAAAEIGVRESPTGSNRVKYWLSEKPSFNGQPWCAGFACWVYRRNGISVNAVLDGITGNNPYYTPYLESAARRLGLWYTGVPRPGDMVIYGNSKLAYGTVIGTDSSGNKIIAKAVHVAIVEKWISSTGRVQEIGGNTSDGMSGSPNNGGGVYRNVRNPNSTGFPIRGYIRMPTAVPVDLRAKGPFLLPANHYYGAADAASTLDHDGTKAGESQAVMQIQAGVGTAIDGVFGSQTTAAVKAWQKAMFRPQTGIVEAADWTVMLGTFTRPERPTGIIATAGVGTATVVFNASVGAQQYTAIIYGTDTTKTATASPITFTGLPAGVPVQITVVAANVGGASPVSARSNTVWPTEGTLTNVDASDGSTFMVAAGSSKTPAMVGSVAASSLDATSYSGFVTKLPASKFTAAIQQAARNVTAVLYDGATFPFPAAKPQVRLEFVASNTLAAASQSTATIFIGRAAATTANVASWLTHEVVHLFKVEAPSYGTSKYVAGLVEGIADYVLVRLGYHDLVWPGAAANWWDGYDTTASFLHYIEHEAPTRSPNFVRRLNQSLKSATWTPAAVTSLNARGMTVDALWAEYRAKADAAT